MKRGKNASKTKPKLSIAYSQRAQSDIILIAAYTEERWGLLQSEAYIAKLNDCFYMLAENPRLGTLSSKIQTGYRRYFTGSHYIFYRPGKAYEIEIIRILHKNQNYIRLLQDELSGQSDDLI